MIAFLAGIESLLSASVADRMIGGRYRPNAEVIAGGAANMRAGRLIPAAITRSKSLSSGGDRATRPSHRQRDKARRNPALRPPVAGWDWDLLANDWFPRNACITTASNRSPPIHATNAKKIPHPATFYPPYRLDAPRCQT
ncbi:hypothetical protein [Roseovarius sp. A-2]|uniref:hypothetical protein n=1 Tax=Roseovarius sp. A-2 TaxID=1570360 RepID=UPI0020CB6A4A|nr:hypothetical protein [Roseovarius sp. A-2]